MVKMKKRTFAYPLDDGVLVCLSEMDVFFPEHALSVCDELRASLDIRVPHPTPT